MWSLQKIKIMKKIILIMKDLFNCIFDLFFPKDIEQDEFTKNFKNKL